MALLRRVGSFRKNHNTYVVSRKPEPDNAERPKGMVRCHTTLLDDTVFTCDIDKHSLADALLNEVFSHLHILERDYFGLAYQDDEVTKWLDPCKHLKKQFKGANTVFVHFRVRFYIINPARLHEELTRYQFYLQVKKDLLTTRLYCSMESLALLGSYILQAELGDYDPHKHKEGYVSHFQLVSKQSVELDEQISVLHQALSGKDTAEAEYQFLAYARRLEFYGVELFRSRDQHGVDLGLGITCRGISVYKGRTHIITFVWENIQKITYKKKRFYIELRQSQGGQLSMVGFYMDTHEGCKQLWKNCIEYHSFFYRSGSEGISPPRGRSRSIRRKAERKSFAGMTKAQAVQANREAAASKSMKLTRKLGSSFRASKSRSPETSRREAPFSAAPLRRSHSVGKESRRPILHLTNGYRCNSTDRELDDDEDDELQMCSPEMSVSDDMTGQFLVPMGASVPAKFLKVNSTTSLVLCDAGPTEYYDERNAQEERLSNVSSDELASEGLMLVRIVPDEQGRYGFIVKGGADETLPVIVTKVTPNSAASLCSPPLEEGDQVLYINGKSVSDKPHEQIVTSIKTSSELVVIVKPRNLQRVHPSLHLRQGFPSSASSCPHLEDSDPGQVLRESLTLLKESLKSGKGQLYFDRLYRRKPGMAAVASKLPQNLVKNRYRDISAYDETRVFLKEGLDYINANYVNMEVCTTGQITKYIASQGPMQHTCKDLWQMVWEERTSLIVMLTEVIEAGKVRCCRYWPEMNCTQEYGKYGITNLSEQNDRIYITRQLCLRNRMSGEERRVVQMQYVDWPDHGVPENKVDFVRFVQGVRSFREGMDTPLVVHCSAGIGRTGALIMLETALSKMEVLEPIYPLDIVHRMRDQRAMLVQTPLQYQFVCESILKTYEDDYVEIELPARKPTPSATAINVKPPSS